MVERLPEEDAFSPCRCIALLNWVLTVQEPSRNVPEHKVSCQLLVPRNYDTSDDTAANADTPEEM
jgi:hypothetical protein